MKKDGGPAFPSDAPTGLAAEQAAAFGRPLENHPGMSLRDYFAAHAMISFMQPGAGVIGVNMYECRVAENAYKIADAMLTERDK